MAKQKPAARSMMGTVWLFVTSNVISTVSFTLVNAVLAVDLFSRGRTASEVGLFALLPFVALLLLAPVTPVIRQRMGVFWAQLLGLAISTLGTAAFILSDRWLDDPFIAWCAINTVLGIAAALLWGIADSLIARHAPKDRIGRISGIAQTALGAAFALGPFLPLLFGLSLQQALLVALAFELLAWVPMAPLFRRIPKDETRKRRFHVLANVQRIIVAAPVLVTAALLGGMFENGVNAISAVHGATIGLASTFAMAVPGAIGLGNVLGQIPIGLLADRLATRPMFIACAVLLLGSSAALAVTVTLPHAIWPIAMVWGAVGGAIYTLALIEIGRRVTPIRIPMATAAMITIYTAGGLVGPGLSGLAVDWSARYGLAIFLALVSLAGLIAFIVSPRTNRV